MVGDPPAGSAFPFFPLLVKFTPAGGGFWECCLGGGVGT